jgi:hypothetical protein
MKPNAKNFERLLRRISKGEEVTEQDLLIQWQGLGKAGDRLLVGYLNRIGGWNSFLKWTPEKASIKSALSDLAAIPGISDVVLQSMQSSGISIPESNDARRQAIWISEAAEKGSEEDWNRARQLLRTDPELVEDVLLLLEGSQNISVWRFLKSLSDEPEMRSHDHQIRKAMYRIKQKLPEQQDSVRLNVTEREIFSFAQNRLPLSQLILYFRPHSAYSPKGDLYFLSILEGQSFDFSQRGHDVEIDVPKLHRIGAEYSERLKGEYRIETEFHPILPAHARYFLQKSARLVEGKPASARLTEFLRFIGIEPAKDPLTGTKKVEIGVNEIFRHPYFSNWMIPLDSLGDFFSKLQSLKEGPIILPESQLKQREHTEKLDTLRSYFASENRAAWSLAFEKAAFFLQQQDPHIAAGSLAVADQLKDENLEPENIPAIPVLLERTLHFHQEQERLRLQEDKRTSLIMSPEEFERSMQRKK